MLVMGGMSLIAETYGDTGPNGAVAKVGGTAVKIGFVEPAVGAVRDSDEKIGISGAKVTLLSPRRNQGCEHVKAEYSIKRYSRGD